MPPALDLLRTSGDALGVREPWQYFWAAGSLSSVLDNAPTYLAFLALAQGQGLAPEVVGVSHDVLAAISLIESGEARDEASIRLGLEGNLCRCTGYHNIVRAVEAAAGVTA